MVPRGEAPAMIAEVETDVLPSLRIQFVGNGSVIESLPNPRMAVKQPAPFAHGAGDPTVGSHSCRRSLPGSVLDAPSGELRDLPGFCVRAPTIDKGLEPLQR